MHFQTGTEEFASLYKIAQAVAGPVLAAATNSPLLFGKRLWRETRIALFQQSVDTRAPAATSHVREQSPRVRFGRGWVDESVMEIFQEDVSRFRVLLAADVEEDTFHFLAYAVSPREMALLVPMLMRGKLPVDRSALWSPRVLAKAIGSLGSPDSLPRDPRYVNRPAQRLSIQTTEPLYTIDGEVLESVPGQSLEVAMGPSLRTSSCARAFYITAGIARGTKSTRSRRTPRNSSLNFHWQFLLMDQLPALRKS